MCVCVCVCVCDMCVCVCVCVCRIKSRLLREQLKAQAAVEQNRKKIEKYEKDLVLLQEGGAKEGRLRGKIEGGLKAPFV